VREALELLAKKPYDLMITDIGMPKMSGWQLAKQIKGKHPRMEVAIMSGHYYELSQEIKNQYGIGYIYTKPIQRDQIKSLISGDVS
jgi:YesN/AraC family two-component response regulator